MHEKEKVKDRTSKVIMNHSVRNFLYHVRESDTEVYCTGKWSVQDYIVRRILPVALRMNLQKGKMRG